MRYKKYLIGGVLSSQIICTSTRCKAKKHTTVIINLIASVYRWVEVKRREETKRRTARNNLNFYEYY